MISKPKFIPSLTVHDHDIELVGQPCTKDRGEYSCSQNTLDIFGILLFVLKRLNYRTMINTFLFREPNLYINFDNDNVKAPCKDGKYLRKITPSEGTQIFGS